MALLNGRPAGGRLTLLLALVLAPAAGLFPLQFTEDRIKGAFLLHFPSFITWPDDPPGAAFTIGVMGDPDLIDVLDRALPTDQIRERPLFFRSVSGPGDAVRCQLVYISGREARLLDATLKAVDGLPILTVSDAPDFLRRGGMIRMFLDGTHLRFAINTRAMERAHLRVSSRLLALARAPAGGRQ